MRKLAFSYAKTKMQIRSKCAPNQCLCFPSIESTISLLPKSKISSHWLFSVMVQPGLCRAWPVTPNTGFLVMQLLYIQKSSLAYEMNVYAY